MKIGIDIDGVLCDFIGPLLKRWNTRYNTVYSPAEVTHFHAITDWGITFGLEDFSSVEVMPGAKENLEWLNLYHDLYIVTARPLYTAQVTHDWLLTEFPFLEERQLVLCHDKHLMRLDCLIDDGPHNLEGFEYAIVYNQPWNRNAPFWRADNWSDVHNLVNFFCAGKDN